MTHRDQQTIYVISPDLAAPSGGVRRLYRHVDVLNANGFNARLMHYVRPFRCTWFANNTRVEYMNEARLRPTDFLVAPEVMGPKIHEMGRGLKTVIFNQNAYYTFLNYSINPADMVTPYRSRELVACICVSDDNRAYLQFAFPELRVFRLHYSIDSAIFQPRPKKPQICFMPRKHPEDAQQVLNILKFRNVLSGFSVLPIDKANEVEVARILGESLIFLCFGYPEGCSLPPMEAMASGCVTIGYHGNGCREYLRPPMAYPFEVGDIVGIAKCVEDVLTRWRSDPAGLNEMTSAAGEYIRTNYSIQREEADIVEIWDKLTAR